MPVRYVWLLPLLKESWPTDKIDLQTAINKLGLKEPLLVHEVSLREVIATAISGSDYWAALAANWLEAGFPMDADLIKAIGNGVQAKCWEQQTRHRLYRLARRAERESHAT